MSTELTELLTLHDIIRYGASQFNKAGLHFGHGTENAWDEAKFLALHELYLPYEDYAEIRDCRLVAEEKRAILYLYERRVHERIPAAYLIHEAWFAGLSFYVNEHVLIPRSPLAEVIEAQFEPWYSEPKTVLDMCTGSGCIAIASALYLDDVKVTACDISADALSVAKKNCQRHALEDEVELIESDLFSQLAGRQFDVIISNPPYVSDEEMASLPKEYAHEPDLALRANDNGMAIVKRLLEQSARFLTEEGVLIVEVGNTAEAMETEFPHIPFTWLSFARGGDGVFLLTKKQLQEYFS